MGKAKAAIGWVKRHPGKAAAGALVCVAAVGLGVVAQQSGSEQDGSRRARLSIEHSDQK